MFKGYLTKVFSLFFILGFVFIPLTFYGLYFQYGLTRFVFLKPVAFIQNHFFTGAIQNIDFSSDTIGLNILLCLLLMMAFLLILLLYFFKIRSDKIDQVFKSVSVYYIAAILLKYGFDKVFKQQFALPEPNILYTNFGSLTRDTLFWSTMGLSHTYSVVTGSIEVLTGILILLRRTRVFGFCLAIGVLLNILLINFSFDISVKTFTAFLLAVVLFNGYPYLKTIYAFFVQHKQVQLPAQTAKENYKWIGVLLSTAIICYCLFPYLSLGNFNGDNVQRPLLHGAYNIERFTIGADTLNSCDFPYKRFFIHRDNYIIFQRQDDRMVDYFFDDDPVNKQLILQDYNKSKIIVAYSYDIKTGDLRLTFGNSTKWVIQSKALNWKALPALQDNTHYTIDEIK